MSKKIILFISLFLLPLLLFPLTPQQIDRYLRNYSEKGYRFIKSEGDNTWFIAFKLPQWKKEWTIVVLFVSSNNVETVIMGSTVASFDREPTPALMRFLLQENSKDNNIGSFSIYASDRYYIQYFVKIPNAFATLDQILYSAGWVAGTCEAFQEEVLKFMR